MPPPPMQPLSAAGPPFLYYGYALPYYPMYHDPVYLGAAGSGLYSAEAVAYSPVNGGCGYLPLDCTYLAGCECCVASQANVQMQGGLYGAGQPTFSDTLSCQAYSTAPDYCTSTPVATPFAVDPSACNAQWGMTEALSDPAAGGGGLRRGWGLCRGKCLWSWGLRRGGWGLRRGGWGLRRGRWGLRRGGGRGEGGLVVCT